MTHLPMLDRQPDDPGIAEMFDWVREQGMEVPNIYRVMGNAPAMLKAWLDFAWTLRLQAKVPRALRELIILRGAQVAGIAYEWAHHRPMALAAGVTEEQIDNLAHWQGSDLFDAKERAVLRLADEISLGPAASPECMAILKENFSPEGVVELVLTASFYVCVSRFLASMDVQVEPDFEHLAASMAPSA